LREDTIASALGVGRRCAAVFRLLDRPDRLLPMAKFADSIKDKVSSRDWVG
jgi:hypothetical protein